MTTPPVDVNALLTTYGRPEVPLVSVAVLDNGKLYTAASPGCTPATLFQAASISKAISAFAAMTLVRMGILHLDQPVNDKLRSWKLQPAPGLSAAGWAPVTLRHLLCHGGAVNVRPFPVTRSARRRRPCLTSSMACCRSIPARSSSPGRRG